MNIRKATINDIDAIEKLYDDIHTAEEKGKQTIGWIRDVYPVRATAQMALTRDDLFVLEDVGKIYGTAIINKTQVDSYSEGRWNHDVADSQVCVLHTLVISPDSAGRGYGSAFVEYYENYALDNDCVELRLDTNARNTVARAMYKKLGYTEIGIVKTDFNGISGIDLVLLEKYL
ncbi:MAG: GNAT family N-acetyltransferase, partial [Lachnospiraceae bacterium]